jgi:hypothetical protein
MLQAATAIESWLGPQWRSWLLGAALLFDSDDEPTRPWRASRLEYGALAASGRDCQRLADHGGVLESPRGGIPERRVDRGQPGVAGGAAVAPLLWPVLQERADQRGVQVGKAERATRRLSG